ncbi:MAG: acetyl-CoA carboxylase biotin carboxylase subunit [Candidatus Cloacimonadota bacterium]|nr:MAG: acetyl-CoA carboxylase biotin carboxylase subunit [Candidatus Cloacimonadota bacterium]
MSRKINRLLIANRGEIAVRIIRACKELDIETVAVYSSADKDSLHVKLADEAICIGPHQVSESYLNVQNIVAAAEISGADAIHPGYGFLSENVDFVDVLKSCKILFIGPEADSIRRMGDKAEARKLMKKNGVPTVPGSKDIIQSIKEGIEVARECGFPVMVKATAGGGGKGMRLVHKEEDFAELFEVASQEALAGFGNGDCYIEKFVIDPRHIEVQILGDNFGNVIHLGERNCSIQRRHQKLLEEAPSPQISDDLRERICQAGVNAAKAVNYKNAGTIEFLVDKDENFYFMEMNTRLQVEHPVTEMVTGVDLVKEQILITEGHKLSYTQDQIKSKGHAIEFRINAEDVKNGFSPCPGKIETLRLPGGPGVRIDTMISSGDEILPFYDSMIAKLIVYDEDRDKAILRGQRALQEFVIDGVSSTIEVHQKILANDTFKSGYFSTSFMDTEIKLND